MTDQFLQLDLLHSKELKAWHRPQLECLAAAGAEVLALETIPSVKEAEALAEVLREFPNCNAWISFSCKVMRGQSLRLVNSMNQPFCAAVSGWDASVGRPPAARWRPCGGQVRAGAGRWHQLLSSGMGGASLGLCCGPEEPR